MDEGEEPGVLAAAVRAGGNEAPARAGRGLSPIALSSGFRSLSFGGEAGTGCGFVTALVGVSAAFAGNDPKPLVLDVTAANIRGQYGKVWPRLHPRYRAVTTRIFWES